MTFNSLTKRKKSVIFIVLHMKQAGFAKYAFLGISVIIILAALGVLFFLTKSSKKMAVQMQVTPTETAQATPTPIITPLTQENAQPTIDATEQNMQQALNQANTDLQAEGQINASQDNTTGL